MIKRHVRSTQKYAEYGLSARAQAHQGMEPAHTAKWTGIIDQT